MTSQAILARPSANSMTEFPFLDDVGVRTAVAEDGGVWFCARDVFECLGLQWAGGRLRNLPREWTTVTTSVTEHGLRDVLFVNEPALYRLIFRSSKPEAERFANWVCGEVLPEIRRHGGFGQVSASQEVSLTRELRALTRQVIESSDAFERDLLVERLRRLCRILGQSMPELTQLGKKPSDYALEQIS